MHNTQIHMHTPNQFYLICECGDRKQYHFCLGLRGQESCEPGFGFGILAPASSSSLDSHRWFGPRCDPRVFEW
jgi:hypothetical protein